MLALELGVITLAPGLGVTLESKRVSANHQLTHRVKTI